MRQQHVKPTINKAYLVRKRSDTQAVSAVCMLVQLQDVAASSAFLKGMLVENLLRGCVMVFPRALGPLMLDMTRGSLCHPVLEYGAPPMA